MKATPPGKKVKRPEPESTDGRRPGETPAPAADERTEDKSRPSAEPAVTEKRDEITNEDKQDIITNSDQDDGNIAEH